MRELKVSLMLDAPVSAVAAGFWDISTWQAFWQPVRSVTVTYDDGVHQIFEMNVEWLGEVRTVRTVRFRDRQGTISFFCSTPPSNLLYQRGQWSFEQVSNGCRITAARTYIPKLDGQTAPEAFDAEFQERLNQILQGYSRFFASVGG